MKQPVTYRLGVGLINGHFGKIRRYDTEKRMMLFAPYKKVEPLNPFSVLSIDIYQIHFPPVSHKRPMYVDYNLVQDLLFKWIQQVEDALFSWKREVYNIGAY
jgi:hypothetical protein